MIKRHSEKCRRSATTRRPSRLAGVAAVLLSVTFICACARPPEEAASPPADSQKMPFARQPRRGGIPPSQTWVPSATKLPEGTTIAVRLQSSLSSATSRAGDTFSATIDNPVEVEGYIVLATGVTATGRVLESKNSVSSLEPGYFRIVLVTLNVGVRPIVIETSSIFAKGAPREEANPSTGGPSTAAHEDIVFDVGRRLNFRLAQTVDLQNSDLQNSNSKNSD